jgi:signal transduction histidine kinase
MTSTVSARRELSLLRAPTSTLQRSLVLLGFLGAVAATGGAVLLATSDHLAYPVGFALLVANLVAGTIAVGLYWLVRRPASPFGPLLVALGFLYAGVSLEGANSPVLHSIGVLFDVPLFLFSAYIVYAFPLGRLRRLERGLLAAGGAVIVLGFLPWFFFSDPVTEFNPLGRCNSACPSNGLQIADLPGIASAFGRVERVLLGLVALAIVVGLGYRSRTAKRPERRARGPVLAWMVAWAVCLGAVAVSRPSPPAAGTPLNGAEWAVTFTRGTLSYSFLVAALLATVFAGAALRHMIASLGARPSSARLRDVVAGSLDDPELELGFWLHGAGELVDSNGQRLEPPPSSERAMTEFADAGNRVAIVHHIALQEDPELLSAAGTAILLSLESGRLQAELRRTNAELRASRMRVVSAADAERRKIERDLHDSAQQQLIALRMRLGLARELAEEGDPELPEVLTEVGEDLDAALTELRGIAHGIYPPLLVEAGLPDALAQAGRRSAIEVHVEHDSIGRYPSALEAAVYFSCVEALQNAAKDGGDGAVARVRVWEDFDLRFEVSDNGAGFDAGRTSRGTGLLGMADRIGAVGGSIEISSAPGRGTTVAGRIPVRI